MFIQLSNTKQSKTKTETSRKKEKRSDRLAVVDPEEEAPHGMGNAVSRSKNEVERSLRRCRKESKKTP